MKAINSKLFLIVSFIFLIALTNICKAQTEIKIPNDSLPQPVKEHLHGKFHDHSVSNIVKVVDKTGGVTYKLEARKEKAGDGTITVSVNYLSYDATGNLLSKTKDKEIFYTGTQTKPKSAPSNDGHNH